MGQQKDLVIICELLLEFQHVRGHFKTYSRATGKKEIGNIDFIVKSILRYGIPQLVHQAKVGNPVEPMGLHAIRCKPIWSKGRVFIIRQLNFPG